METPRHDDPAALVQASHLLKLRGDHPGALALVDRAVAILAPAGPSIGLGAALLARGGLLDRLGHVPLAGACWLEAARCFPAQPMMQLVCEAHAAGTELRRALTGGAGTAPPLAPAIAHARGVIARLGADGDPGLLIGLLGAIGESAGELEMAFLPQAMFVMAKRVTGLNRSTAPYWDRFIHAMGDASPISLSMLSLAFVCQGMERDAAKRAQLQPVIHAVIARCATARATTPDALLGQVQAGAAAMLGLADALGESIPPELWLL